jgi:hypothetical protein
MFHQKFGRAAVRAGKESRMPEKLVAQLSQDFLFYSKKIRQ